MNKDLILVAIIGFLLPFSTLTNVRAETITVELSHLVGELEYGDGPLSSVFNTEVRFSSIDSITVRIVGRGEEGLLRVISPEDSTEKYFDPPLSVKLPKDVGVYPGSWADIVADNGTAGTTWEARFGPPVSQLPGYFHHLLDGRGEVILSSRNAFAIAGDTMLEVLEPSRVELTGAWITIVGVVVPEPASSILLFASVVALFFGMHHHGKRARSAG